MLMMVRKERIEGTGNGIAQMQRDCNALTVEDTD
jgi:hypothetical protein